jgi:hypothetical protein
MAFLDPRYGITSSSLASSGPVFTHCLTKSLRRYLRGFQAPMHGITSLSASPWPPQPQVWFQILLISLPMVSQNPRILVLHPHHLPYGVSEAQNSLKPALPAGQVKTVNVPGV